MAAGTTNNGSEITQSGLVSFNELRSVRSSVDEGNAVFNGAAVSKTNLHQEVSLTPPSHSSPRTTATDQQANHVQSKLGCNPLAGDHPFTKFGFADMVGVTSGGTQNAAGSTGTNGSGSVRNRAKVNTNSSKSWSLSGSLKGLGQAIIRALCCVGNAVASAFCSSSKKELPQNAENFPRMDNLRSEPMSRQNELRAAGQNEDRKAGLATMKELREAQQDLSVKQAEHVATRKVASLARMLNDCMKAKVNSNTSQSNVTKLNNHFIGTCQAVQKLVAAEQRKSPDKVKPQELQDRLHDLMKEAPAVKKHLKSDLADLDALELIGPRRLTTSVLKNAHLESQRSPNDLDKQLQAKTIETSLAAFHNDSKSILDSIDGMKAGWTEKSARHE